MYTVARLSEGCINRQFPRRRFFLFPSREWYYPASKNFIGVITGKLAITTKNSR